MLYSHSRLSAFEQCPLKFKLQYIDKAEAVQEEGIEAFLGSRAHEALEKLYQDLAHARLLGLKELLEFYNNEWKKNWNDQIVIVKKDYTEKDYRKMGERFLTDYYKRYEPFDQERTIGLEQKVKVKLDETRTLIGYIDRLVYVGKGVYEVHDYKTNSNLPLQEYQENDRQLALYAIAVREGYKDAKDVRLVWHFLAFDKKIVVEKTVKQLEQLKKDTVGLIKKIEAEKDFKPRTSKLCGWCKFRPTCPQWKHLYKLRDVPPNKYLQDSGVKLVNKLADLREKKKEAVEKLDNDIKEVQGAIITLAKKEGIDVVFGSNKKAKVWCKDCIKFPGKQDKDREKLEEAVRDMGKWDEVSSLNTIALAKVAEARGWPAELLAKIKKYQRMEKVERIYLSKLKTEG